MKRTIALILLSLVPWIINSQPYERAGYINFTNESNSLKTVDLDNDGEKDLIMSYLNQEFVTISYQENGQFKPASALPTKLLVFNPVVYTVDINADSFYDIVVHDRDSTLHLLFNNGDRTFQSPIIKKFENTISPARFFHFNDDELIDLVTINEENNEIVIFHGDGAGGFEKALSIEKEQRTNQLEYLDIDSDNDKDIITYHWTDRSYTVQVLLNIDGDFVDSGILAESLDKNTTMSIQDLDADGHYDIILNGLNSSALYAPANESVEVFYGLGDLEYSDVKSFELPREVIRSKPKFSDLNHDGLLDLVFKDFEGSVITMMIALEDRDYYMRGQFFANASAGTYLGPLSFIDSDEHLNEILAFEDYTQELYKATIATDLKLRDPIKFRTWYHMEKFDFGDLDSDGYQDIVFTSDSRDYIHIRYGTGNERFDIGQAYTAGQGTNDVRLADFDLNGHLDVITNGQVPGIMFNDGNGNFNRIDISGTNSWGSMLIQDINEDQMPDLVIGHNVYLNDGQTNLNHVYSFDSEYDGYELLNYNADGTWDVLAFDSENDKVLIYTGNGEGQFEEAHILDVHANQVDIVDFNSDGYSDLVISDFDTDVGRIYMGSESGNYSSQGQQFEIPFHSTETYLIDFDGDGKIDILNSRVDQIHLYTPDEQGFPGDLTTHSFQFGSHDQLIHRDFTFDGQKDLVISDEHYGIKTLTQKFVASIDFNDLNRTYTGLPQDNLVSTIPAGLGYQTLFNNSSATIENAGTHTMEITIDDDDYKGYAEAVLEISKVDLYVYPEDQSRPYGSPNNDIKLVYEHLVGDDREEDLDNPPSITTKANITSPVGSYQVVLFTTDDTNYNYKPSDGTINVT